MAKGGKCASGSKGMTAVPFANGGCQEYSSISQRWLQLGCTAKECSGIVVGPKRESFGHGHPADIIRTKSLPWVKCRMAGGGENPRAMVAFPGGDGKCQCHNPIRQRGRW